jgi:hypothetical protein
MLPGKWAYLLKIRLQVSALNRWYSHNRGGRKLSLLICEVIC